MFGTDLYAQLVLINKVSALELSWKFIKSALFVGSESKQNYSTHLAWIPTWPNNVYSSLFLQNGPILT